MSAKRKPVLVAVGVAAATIMTACGGGDTATPSATETSDMASETMPEDPATSETATTVAAEGDLESICEAGRSEGAIQRWASGQVELFEAQVQPFIDEFGIDVEFTVVGPGEKTTRLLAENQAGRAFTPDVIEGSTIEFAPILNDNYLEAVDWAAEPFNFPADQLTQGTEIPGLRIFRTFSGIAYNTDAVAEDDLPDTFDDLADAKWAGRLNVQPNGAYWVHLPTSQAMGLEGAQAWLDKFLEEAQPIPLHGGTASLQAVAAGQIDIATNSSSEKVEEFLAESPEAPIGFKVLDYVAASDHSAFLVKGSPRSNAVKCYLAWWGSEEASALRYADEFKTNITEPEGLPDNARVIALETPEDIAIAQAFTSYVTESVGE